MTYLPGMQVRGVGVTACDVNADGAPDLLYAGNNTTLFLNNGLGVFAMQPQSQLPAGPFTDPNASANGVVCADLDLDGWNDLAIMWEAGSASKVAYWHNRHDGTFDDLGSSGFPDTLHNETQLAAVDLNQDGWIDLVASAAGCTGFPVPFDAQLFMNQGGTFVEVPGFMPRTGGGCVRIQAINANADAKPDLAVVKIGTSTASTILINTTP